MKSHEASFLISVRMHVVRLARCCIGPRSVVFLLVNICPSTPPVSELIFYFLTFHSSLSQTLVLRHIGGQGSPSDHCEPFKLCPFNTNVHPSVRGTSSIEGLSLYRRLVPLTEGVVTSLLPPVFAITSPICLASLGCGSSLYSVIP